MPDFAIVDSHVHLYDTEAFRYSWMSPPLDRPHGPVAYGRARENVEVEAIVWVEVGADPGQHLAEAAWLETVARRDPRIAGMVAAAPLEKGAAVAPDLERLQEHSTLRGIRRLIQDETEPGFCTRPGFVEGVRLLQRFGLSFDLCIRHWQMRDAIELCRRCPDVAIVLDHIGKPGIREGLMEPWRSEIRELAALPHLHCKLSGVITEAGQNWSRAQIRPYIDHVLDVFGPERVMFGSDWTVSTLTHAFPAWVAEVDHALAGCSDVERRQVFRDTAIKFYRLHI